MKLRLLSLLMSIVLLLSAGIPAVAAEATESEEIYESPIDFEKLQQTNPDIYAWLRIEDTVIDYPIVQNPDMDDYYLHHDSGRNINLDGAIFSQATYNEANFTDPEDMVTVLYGHNMKSGSMFGTLREKYSDLEFFDGHKDIIVFSPEGKFVFKVFAAVPYSDELILYKHDFEEEKDYDNFFDGVFNIRDLSARYDEANKPVFGDRVLILSTCISGTNLRFLVMATLESDLENRSES